MVDVLIGLFHSGSDSAYDGRIALKLGLSTPNTSGMVAKSLREFQKNHIS